MEYQTRQRKLLLDFFNSHIDQKFTAKMILKNLAEPISLSAVYRNLTKLEHEGFLKRFSSVGDSEIFYQYINLKSCKNILHMSCTNCKKSFHIHSDEAKQIEKVLEKEHFSIDNNKTIIYGLCEHCKN